MREDFEGDVPLMEELAEQDLHDVAQNGGTISPIQMATFIHRVSMGLGAGGYGRVCTLSKECMPGCS
ncbi:plantaricin C family lantibiotic [Streptomyces milbemycinicus]|uniref:Plantaricin C family lantibiotic n=1 Tax=Streptomyces milbemycinicus TaxID=476552 RepID=A0ABW8LNL8_9ACTN